jgi:L-alanine-DL-glutamate epimerase-like enolase superfamily enzyme
MKISKFEARIVNLPIEQPFTQIAVDPNAKRAFVALRLWADDGIEGIGLTSFGAGLTKTLKSAVDQLCELIIGEDPLRIEAIHKKIYNAAAPAGPEGIYTLALSAIDIALWDIKGHALGQPVWKLLGGLRDRVPTYASGTMMRTFSDEDVAKAAAKVVELGFNEMKMHLAMPGSGSVKREIERAKLVRDVIGPERKLMADINQRWRPEQAMAIGQQLEQFNLTWLEDVTACLDYQGMAQVTQALTTPVAAGELLWGVTPFRHMIEMRSVDIVMIDILRVGGITNWLKVAAMAEAFNMPVISHLLPEIQAHVVAAAPNGLTLEFMPWSSQIYEEIPWPQKGEVLLSDKPGLGLKFSKESLEKYGA